mgnify:CR=1 FL=1
MYGLAVQVDVETLDFLFGRDAQTDQGVDDLEDDPGRHRAPRDADQRALETEIAELREFASLATSIMIPRYQFLFSNRDLRKVKTCYQESFLPGHLYIGLFCTIRAFGIFLR